MNYKIEVDLFAISNWFILYYLIQYFCAPIIYWFQPTTFLKLDIASFNNTGYSIFLISLGLLSFIIGNQIKLRFRKIILFKKPDFDILKFQATFISVIAIVLFIILIKHEGGIATYLKNIDEFRVRGMIGKGIYYYAALGILPMIIIWIIYQSVIQNLKPPYFLIVTMGLIYMVCVLFMGFRGPLISFLISILVLIDSSVRKIKLKQFIIASFLLFFSLVFGAILRKKTNNNYFDLDTYSGLSTLKRSNGLLVLNQTLERKKQSQATISEVLRESVTVVVPKILWKDKPTPLSRAYTLNVFDMKNTNVSPTVLGYIVWLFNPFAIIPFMFLLGFLYKWLDIFIKHQQTDSFSFVNIWYFINFPSFIFVAESPQIALNQIFMASFILTVLYLMNNSLSVVKKLII